MPILACQPQRWGPPRVCGDARQTLFAERWISECRGPRGSPSVPFLDFAVRCSKSDHAEEAAH